MAGCPVFSSSQVLKFLAKNKWFTGTILLVSGALIMWKGWNMFRVVMASVSSVLLFFTLLTLMGYYNSPESVFVRLLISLMLGASFWYLLFKFKKLQLGMMGAVGGFFLGCFIWMVFASLFQFES
jgi:hypothetical protein